MEECPTGGMSKEGRLHSAAMIDLFFTSTSAPLTGQSATWEKCARGSMVRDIPRSGRWIR
ncbi:MAG TPA: hypothetical protein VGF67_11065 [Ktedonobacteraceae bacterium]|jgi:hypothetical protein